MFIKYYRDSRFSSRIIATALALLLGGLIAWRFQYDIPTTLSLVLGFAFIGEAFFFHRRLFVTSTITLIQILALGSISLLVYSILGNYTNQTWGFLVAVGLQLVGLGAVIVSLAGSYFFAKGRLWFNTLLCFIVYDTILILFIINTIDFSFVLAAIIALGGVIVTIIFKSIFPLSKKNTFNVSSIMSQKASTAVQAKIAKSNSGFIFREKNERLFFALNKKVVFAIFPLTPKKDFAIVKHDLILDGQVITSLLEYILEKTKEYSRENKINTKYFIPIIYVTTKSSIKTKIVNIKVYVRDMPEKTLGSVFIVSPDGFNSLIQGYDSQKDMKLKDFSRISSEHKVDTEV